MAVHGKGFFLYITYYKLKYVGIGRKMGTRRGEEMKSQKMKGLK